MIERLAVAIVAAEDDESCSGLAPNNAASARQIGGEGAAAPGVERVAVAGDKADQAVDLGPRRWRQRRQLQIRRGGDVEDQLGKTA